jgi:hypothetical protein
MRVAFLFYGNSPFTSKQKKPGKYASIPSFHKYIVSANPGIRVFFHTWDVKHADELVKIYNPAKYIAEPYVTNDALISVSLSMRRVYDLMKTSGEQFDIVMLCRFDIVWNVRVDLSKFDPTKFTVSYWGIRDKDKNHTWDRPFYKSYYGTHDIFFISNPDAMGKFCSFSDHVQKYLDEGIPWCHHITKRYHMNKMGLLDIIQFHFIVGIDLEIESRCLDNIPTNDVYVQKTI